MKALKACRPSVAFKNRQPDASFHHLPHFDVEWDSRDVLDAWQVALLFTPHILCHVRFHQGYAQCVTSLRAGEGLDHMSNVLVAVCYSPGMPPTVSGKLSMRNSPIYALVRQPSQTIHLQLGPLHLAAGAHLRHPTQRWQLKGET